MTIALWIVGALLVLYFIGQGKNEENNTHKLSKNKADNILSNVTSGVEELAIFTKDISKGIDDMSNKIDCLLALQKANKNNRLAFSVQKKSIEYAIMSSSMKWFNSKDHFELKRKISLELTPKLKGGDSYILDEEDDTDVTTLQLNIPYIAECDKLDKEAKNDFQNMLDEHNELIIKTAKELKNSSSALANFKEIVPNYSDVFVTHIVKSNKIYTEKINM